MRSCRPTHLRHTDRVHYLMGLLSLSYSLYSLMVLSFTHSRMTYFMAPFTDLLRQPFTLPWQGSTYPLITLHVSIPLARSPIVFAHVACMNLTPRKEIDTSTWICKSPLHLYPIFATQYTHYARLQTHFGKSRLHT